MTQHSNDQAQGEAEPLRLIVIDDDTNWCTVLGHMVRSMGYTLDAAGSLEEARQRIGDAERAQRRYTIAIIDMNFKISGFDLVQGEEIIEYIKKNHPYIACVIASSERMSPEDVLDLRDNKGLDYYLLKERISIDKVRRAIQRSLQRTQAAAVHPTPEKPPAVRLPPEPATLTTSAPSAPRRQPDDPATPAEAAAQIGHIQLDLQQQGGTTTIVWRAPLIGREVTTFCPPYTEQELPLVIRCLDLLQYPGYPTPATTTEQEYFSFSADEQILLARLGLWANGQVASNAFQTVGQALYQALGPEGRRIVKTVRNTSIAQGLTTNYVLRFPAEAIALAALPWELLWDDEKNQAVLIRGHRIDSCERYMDIDVAIPPPLPAGHRLHALALSPAFAIPDSVREAERTVRLKTWEQLRADGKLTFGEISPLTMASLNDYLLDVPQRPDIVHYFGHGTYREGKGYLVFDDGQGGRDLVSAERLAATLGDVRLVVIHACQSAMVDAEHGLLTGIAPALSIVAGAVVAMQLTVRTAAATRFTQVFYEQLLGRGHSVQEAVARSRQILFSETPDGASWYVPTLYIRSRTIQPLYFTR